MNPVLQAFLYELAVVTASGVLVGGTAYGAGTPLRLAITAGLVAAAAQPW